MIDAASDASPILHGYFRSAASWRVRIALALKGLPARQAFHHPRRGGQQAPSYLALNPQGLVPALELADGTVLTQSVAIIEWLDETVPKPPLLPTDPVQRARVRAKGWAVDTNRAGLYACTALLAAVPEPFRFGPQPRLADICLVPQLGNARRFGVDVSAYPRLLARETACMALPAFADAVLDCQPDAE